MATSDIYCTNAVSANEIDDFINGALVSWLESCLPRPEILTGYSSLVDGHIIHSIWLQIDPEPQHSPTVINENNNIAMSLAKVKNFECIVRNLKFLFEEEFGQIILVLPDCYILGYHPESKQGLEQMKILLTLLLGAAVQCPNKELFIARIKELDVDTQHAIVEFIKQVTDNHSLVLTEDSMKVLTPKDIYNQILRLTKERDNMYLKWISSVCVERDMSNPSDCAENSSNLSLSAFSGLTSMPVLSSSSTGNNHLTIEYSDLKSKLIKLKQELEEKLEAQLELREELEHKNVQYEKLRLESQEWYSEAQRASAYRDEVDVLRERAECADRLEIELQKFKEKLIDSEFYKTRVEELREDNRMLLESKEMLEEQLQRWRGRSEDVMFLESEINKYKKILYDMALERDSDRSRLEELIEENTQLQLDAKNFNNTVDMDKTFSDNKDDYKSGDNSLSEQLSNNAQTHALKLELENRRLTLALDKLKETSFHESTNKLLDLEKEKKKKTKLEKMQENIQRLSQQNIELEKLFKEALEENKKIQFTLDQIQKVYDKQSQEREVDQTKILNFEEQVQTLKKEKQNIQTLHENVQRRAEGLERIVESRSEEIEKYIEKIKALENQKETEYELQTKLNSFERENTSFSKEVCKLKENLEEKSIVLDKQSRLIETQNKKICNLTKAFEEAIVIQNRLYELESQNQELMSQREIDLETISTLHSDLVSASLATNKVIHSLENLGLNVDPADENSELNVKTFVEKLVRNPETFKTVREIMLNVSKEEFIKGKTISDICVLCHRKEIFTVEKNIELSSISVFEVTEFEKLSEANTQLNAKNVELQSTHDQLQAENASFKVEVATLCSKITSLNIQHTALQLTNSQLAADKDVLLKENEKLKQKQKHKTLLQDQATLQSLHYQLSFEYESLKKDQEHLKVVVRDLRNDGRELYDHIGSLEKQVDDLKQQNNSLKTCCEDLSTLRTEHSKLTYDFRSLFATSDRFKNEYKNVQEQYKMIRMENSNLKIQNNELTEELGSRNEMLKFLEIQHAKAAQHCKMLVQQNVDLDTERKTLMDNVSHLLKQYHELLTLSLDDKKHFHEEEKTYTECVHNLNRQKEKLEEKIMEHFKKSGAVAPKKKTFYEQFGKTSKEIEF